MVTILRTEYIASERFSTFEQSEVGRLKRLGWKVVNEPKYADQPYVMSKPSKVLVTYMNRGQEITEDYKYEITKAYNKYFPSSSKDKISRFTKSDYERFLRDYKMGKIEARWSKYPGKALYFVVR